MIKDIKNTWNISTWKRAHRFLGRGMGEKNALPEWKEYTNIIFSHFFNIKKKYKDRNIHT